MNKITKFGSHEHVFWSVAEPFKPSVITFLFLLVLWSTQATLLSHQAQLSHKCVPWSLEFIAFLCFYRRVISSQFLIFISCFWQNVLIFKCFNLPKVKNTSHSLSLHSLCHTDFFLIPFILYGIQCQAMTNYSPCSLFLLEVWILKLSKTSEFPSNFHGRG